MARIEIDYSVYQGLKDKIDSLENTNVSLLSKLKTNEHRLYMLTYYLEDVVETGLFERVFKWGKTLKALKSVIKIYGSKDE